MPSSFTDFLGLPTFCKEESWIYLNALGLGLSHKHVQNYESVVRGAIT